jgi:hypothetical protein
MAAMNGATKVTATAGLFLVAVATVVLAAVTHRAVPLFFAWIPLIGVGWVLSRPEPGTTPGQSEAPPSGED